MLFPCKLFFMLAVTNSGALIGVQAEAITIEVNSGERGELRYILVGLPDSAVKESQDRVLSALDNCGFQAPNTKTTINLAPGDLKKEGPSQRQLLQDAINQLNLSVRAYDRILKVARTIADLADTASIQDTHLLEAIQYRNLDRSIF
jgi:predicted ATPase with chaperone activity